MRRAVCFVVASPLTFEAFFLDHFRRLALDYCITLVANFQERRCSWVDSLPVTCVNADLQRAPSPARDLRGLLQLFRLFRRGNFDSVHSVTPKAGLLAMLAGRAAGVRTRIHLFTGQVWVTRHGLARWGLRSADRVVAGLATHVLADSLSQLRFLEEQGVIPRGRGLVLGGGSVSGVDTGRFRPDAEARVAVRVELGISAEEPVILFLGRLTAEKGVWELVEAFRRVVSTTPAARLVLVGPDEEEIGARLLEAAGNARERVRLLGFTTQPQRLLAAADVFCLPSHREGFGSVVIEAAATGVPAVVSRIYGLTDAVVEGVTGLFHPVGGIAGLASALDQLLADPALRERLGRQARERATALFTRERSIRDWRKFYASALAG